MSLLRVANLIMTEASGIGTSPRVSVVCPFFNEESIIENATRRMIGNLDEQFGTSWELVLVNDGSKDASLDTLLNALQGSDRERVKVVSYPLNQGRGRALKTGIDQAEGDIIVTTEVDCSWGDDIVARLVAELDGDPSADFVVASPHLPGGRLVNVPTDRIFYSRMGNKLIRAFFSSEVTMNTGMTRAYRRQVIKPLIVMENGKEFHLEVLLKLLTLGFKVKEIPSSITWQDHKLAKDGSSKRKSSTNIKKTIFSHLRFVAIAQPVRYFSLLSILSLLLGFGFLFSAVFMLLIEGPAVFLAMIGLLMMIFCLMFLGFSILFFEFREVLRELWMRPYEGLRPPTAKRGGVVFPN